MNFSYLKENSYLIPLVVFFLILTSGSALYLQTAHTMESDEKTSKTLLHLLNQQHQLSEMLSLLNNQLILNTDNINHIEKSMLKNITDLKSQILDTPELTPEINQIEKEFLTLKKQINTFIALNSVYRNSLNFLPHSAKQCQHSLPTEEQKLQVTTLFTTFINHLLQQKIKQYTPNFTQQNSNLTHISQQTPQCQQLVQHINIINDYGKKKSTELTLINHSNLRFKLTEFNANFEKIRTQNHYQNKLIYILLSVINSLFLLYIFFLFKTDKRIQKKLQQQTLQLNTKNQQYKTLSAANQALFQLNSEQQIFEKMTQIMTKHLGVANCWIGIPNQNKQVTPVAISGEFKQVILNLKVSIDPNNKAESGPSAQAFHTQKPVIINDYLQNNLGTPWADFIQKYQAYAMASFPILVNQQSYGILVIYAHQKNFFTQDLVDIIQEICNDLSIALEKLALIKLQQKQQNELELAAIAFDTRQPIMITAPDGKIIKINQAFTQTTGYSEQEVLGKTPRIFKSGLKEKHFYKALWDALLKKGYWHGELENRKKDGSLFPVEQEITAHYNDKGEIIHFISHFSDITHRKQSQAKIDYLSSFDTLTGLANSEQLALRIQQILTQHTNTVGFLLLINLNRFKLINESLGNEAGDQLLKAIGERLQHLQLKSATDLLPARISGDEFALLVTFPQPENETATEELANQTLISIETLFNRPFLLNNTPIDVSISIGVTLFNGQDNTLTKSEILQQANIALHRARQNPNTQAQFFESEMQIQATESFKLERALRQAVKNNEFILHYQPQLNPSKNRYCGAESLIRWQTPEGKLMRPDLFIPMLEHTKLIVPVGYWILETALKQTMSLKDFHHQSYTVSVNLSAVQFQEADLVPNILNIIKKLNFPMQRVMLEVTETAIVEDLKTTVEKLTAFANEGIPIAIDDFGTGYSSLNHLKNMPIHELKIDKSFIDDITQPKDSAIVKTIINLAKGLNLSAIAEGVEDKTQLDTLTKMGCENIQGYYFSKPLPFDELQTFITKFNGPQT